MKLYHIYTEGSLQDMKLECLQVVVEVENFDFDYGNWGKKQILFYVYFQSTVLFGIYVFRSTLKSFLSHFIGVNESFKGFISWIPDLRSLPYLVSSYLTVFLWNHSEDFLDFLLEGSAP